VKEAKATPPELALDPSIGIVDGSRPLGVYVHFPFCTARCPYCDFAVTVRPEIPHDAYASAVLAELNIRGAWFKGDGGPRLVSIYFGGGTPGRWRADALGRVLSATQRMFDDSGAALEITVEANPGDLESSTLRELRALGVNRLSFGAQAFQDRLLRSLGRQHDAAAIADAFGAARAAGFGNLCADLMFGLPDQTMIDWRESLDALCSLAPDHITAYALTVEPGTAFGALERAGKLQRPGDETVAAMYSLCHDTLTAAGYEHYEISSYARPGRRSVHNSLYWTMGAYLGLGVSASSFRPLAGGNGWRFANPRSFGTYMRQMNAGAVPPVHIERRSPAQVEDEALWLALRMSDGVDREVHRRRHGADPLTFPERSAAAAACVKAGWLEITPRSLRLLPTGFLFADEVAIRLARNLTG
jgi:oxygen-independent coproporphyrinogen-3 oxidase